MQLIKPILLNLKFNAMQNFNFTSMQCLHAIAYWPHESFTLKELNYLLQYFASEPANLNHTYGLNDIHSLILEILSEIDN